MFSQGETVNVAVSGGRDSVFLFHLLGELGYARRVLHVNHKLRPEADEEEQFVRMMAEAAGCECVIERAQAPIADGNLEQNARRFRLQFFHRFGKVATAHTRSDQAETVLFRLLRGSGVTGLRGILPVTREGLVRPLLDVTRAEIDEWLVSRQIEFRDDPSNQSLDFARNRIRHQLLPQLEREWNPRIAETLARVADLSADEEAYWEAAVDGYWDDVAATIDDAVLLRVPKLAELPAALARRVLRRAALIVKGDIRQLEFPHIEQLRDLATADEGSGRVIAPGLDAMRSFEWIRLTRPAAPSVRNWEMSIEFPFTADLPGGGRIRVYNKNSFGQAFKPLILRNWRPGDRIRRMGESDESRIKQLFQDARIPLWERRNWPVLAAGDDVLWTAQFGFAEGAAGFGVDYAPPLSFITMNRDESGMRP